MYFFPMESVLHCCRYSCSIIAVSHLAIRAIAAIYILCYAVPKLCCPLEDSACDAVIFLATCPLGLWLCGVLGLSHARWSGSGRYLVSHGLGTVKVSKFKMR